MSQFGAAQQTSTTKLPEFFRRSQTEERALRVHMTVLESQKQKKTKKTELIVYPREL